MSGEPVVKQAKMSSALDAIKEKTVVVADTGDFGGMARISLQTTSLITITIRFSITSIRLIESVSLSVITQQSVTHSLSH